MTAVKIERVVAALGIEDQNVIAKREQAAKRDEGLAVAGRRDDRDVLTRFPPGLELS